MGRSRMLLAVLALTLGMFVSDSTWTAKRAGAEQLRPLVMHNIRAPVHKNKRAALKRQRNQTDDDLNSLDARLALLWARVEEIETRILAQSEREEPKANA